MGNPVCHFEIVGSNAGKTIEFYQTLFGWDIKWEDQMKYGLIDTGGPIGGGIMEATENIPPMISYYIEVSDIDEYLKKATELGAEVVQPKTEIPETGWVAMFKDPDDNMIGLYTGMKKES